MRKGGGLLRKFVFNRKHLCQLMSRWGGKRRGEIEGEGGREERAQRWRCSPSTELERQVQMTPRPPSSAGQKMELSVGGAIFITKIAKRSSLGHVIGWEDEVNLWHWLFEMSILCGRSSKAHPFCICPSLYSSSRWRLYEALCWEQTRVSFGHTLSQQLSMSYSDCLEAPSQKWNFWQKA